MDIHFNKMSTVIDKEVTGKKTKKKCKYDYRLESSGKKLTSLISINALIDNFVFKR